MLCLAAAGYLAVTERVPEHALAVNCDTHPRAGAIFDLNAEKFLANVMLELSTSTETREVHVSNASGHLAIGERVVLSHQAGQTLLRFGDGARLIAGAPIPEKLDGYYAGDEALTLACPDATPATVAESNAQR